MSEELFWQYLAPVVILVGSIVFVAGLRAAVQYVTGKKLYELFELIFSPLSILEGTAFLNIGHDPDLAAGHSLLYATFVDTVGPAWVWHACGALLIGCMAFYFYAPHFKAVKEEIAASQPAE